MLPTSQSNISYFRQQLNLSFMLQEIYLNPLNLLELNRKPDGLHLSIFSRQNTQSRLQNSSLMLSSMEQIGELNKYFETLDEFRDYLQVHENIQFVNGDLDIYCKVVGKRQKIGNLKMIPDEQMCRQNFDYINSLCMSERKVDDYDIKSMLLRLSSQVEFLSDTRCSIKHQQYDPILKKEEQVKPNQKTEQIEELTNVFQKKLESVSQQLQKNRLIMLEKLNQPSEKVSNQIIQLKDSLTKMNKKIKILQKQVQEKLIPPPPRSIMIGQQIPMPNQMPIPRQMPVSSPWNMPIMPQIPVPRVILPGRDFIKIKDLEPMQENLNIIAKVLSVEKLNKVSSRMKVLLGDETGIITGVLLKNPLLKQGYTILLTDCWVNVYMGHMQVQLTIKKGILLDTELRIQQTKMSNNMSEREWVEAT